MRVGVAHANEEDASAAGKSIAETAVRNAAIHRPDFVFAFCHGSLDHEAFFRGLQSVLGSHVPIVGGSSIGFITHESLSYTGHPAAGMVLQADDLQCTVAAAPDLDKDERAAGRGLAEMLSRDPLGDLLFFLYDSIKVPASAHAPPVLNSSSPLIEGMESLLTPRIPIIGAGLMGDFDLGPPRLFCGNRVASQCVVGVLVKGPYHPYVRIMHGCTPLNGVYHKITRMEGSNVYELDEKPVLEVIDSLYGNQDWRQEHPVKLLTIGQNWGARFGRPSEDQYVNRLITGALPDGEGIGLFEPDLQVGSEILFMVRDPQLMIDSAKLNSKALVEEIAAQGKKACFGLYIDCAGRAASYSDTTREEAAEVQEVFNRHGIPLLGFYSGVEVAPSSGRSRGLDWTGVLLVFAEDA